MKFTVKQIKEYIQNLSDDQVLDFVGLTSIDYTKTVSLFSTNNTSVNTVRNCGLGEDIFYNEPTPIRMTIPRDIMELLGWKDDKSTRAKIDAFVNTLLLVWDPNKSISELDHKKLNTTTLSRALFITKTQGKGSNSKTSFDTDNTIDRIILTNLPYLRNKCRNNF